MIIKESIKLYNKILSYLNSDGSERMELSCWMQKRKNPWTFLEGHWTFLSEHRVEGQNGMSSPIGM